MDYNSNIRYIPNFVNIIILIIFNKHRAVKATEKVFKF